MNFLKDSDTIENLYDFNKNSDIYKEYEKYLETLTSFNKSFAHKRPISESLSIK